MEQRYNRRLFSQIHMLQKQQSDLRGLIEQYESHLSRECSRS